VVAVVLVFDDGAVFSVLSNLVNDLMASNAPGNSGASVMISISSNDGGILSPMSYFDVLSSLLIPYTSFTVEMP